MNSWPKAILKIFWGRAFEIVYESDWESKRIAIKFLKAFGSFNENIKKSFIGVNSTYQFG
jgi:hypothetical protein